LSIAAKTKSAATEVTARKTQTPIVAKQIEDSYMNLDSRKTKPMEFAFLLNSFRLYFT
jgi:hypothetical protein